jgi:hypothetical protein
VASSSSSTAVAAAGGAPAPSAAAHTHTPGGGSTGAGEEETGLLGTSVLNGWLGLSFLPALRNAGKGWVAPSPEDVLPSNQASKRPTRNAASHSRLRVTLDGLDGAPALAAGSAEAVGAGDGTGAHHGQGAGPYVWDGWQRSDQHREAEEG